MGQETVSRHVFQRPISCREIRRLSGALAAFLMLIFGALPATASPSGGSGDARGRYLVVLHDSTSSARAVAAEHRQRHGAEIHHVYQHALKGYAAELPEQALQGIARDPRVAFVEQDQTVKITSQITPTGVARIFAPNNATLDIDGTDDVRVDVDLAILDTGIADHPDLNVASIADCTASGSLGFCIDDTGEDDHGHGTHVAGTAAGRDNDFGVVGVAPGARLHGLKVLSATGSGLLSWSVAGIDWVTERSHIIEVVNMSLGCKCTSAALDQALTNSVERGIVYAVAAGNDDEDASRFSPANHPDVITVSALADFDGAPGGEGPASCRSDVDDTLAEFSNWGSAVEIAAPGVCILSTSLNDRYRTLSGTSMASPHVAGAAAILTSGANDPRDRADVSVVRDAVIGWGNLGWVDDSGDGLQEPLLDVGNSDVFLANDSERTLGSWPPPPPANQAPLAEFAYSCSKLTCSFDGTGSSDPDGTISSYAWDLGDGTTATGATVENTYGSSNIYTVRLDVVDDGGATSTTSQEIEVSDGAASGGNDDPITLNAGGVRVNGMASINLEWWGTDLAGMVVVYRNDAVVATTADDGDYTDTFENSSGSITYRICEEGTTRCSNQEELFQ